MQKLKLTHFWDPDAQPATDDESRFLSLKRAIDGGMDAPELWAEYLVLAIQLGAREQARIAMRHLRGSQRGQRLLENLGANGVLEGLKRKSPGASPPQRTTTSPPGQRAAAAKPTPVRETQAPRQQQPRPQPRQQRPRQQTSARPAGNSRARQPEPRRTPQRTYRPTRSQVEPERVELPVPESVREEAIDALQYLLLGSVPMRIVWLTVAFPAAIAIGQILLPADPGALAPLGVLPCVLVGAAVMHYARAILLTSADGAEEPPQMYSGMLAGSIKAAFVSLVLLLACVGPGVLGITLGQPFMYSLPLLAFGMLYLPMALLGVTVRRSFDAALPQSVFRGMAAHSGDYAKVWVFAMLAAALPIGVLVAIGDVPLHMQLAVGGPLAIVPGLFLARLLGRYFYSRRTTLAKALGVRLRRARKVVNERARQREPQPHPVDSGRRIDANPPNGRHRGATTGDPAQMGNHTHTPLRRRQ